MELHLDMDILLVLQTKDIHHQDSSMVIGMVLEPMVLDLAHLPRALIPKDLSRGHHLECHFKAHLLVKDPPEDHHLVVCLQILEALHLDQTGTDRLDQACHTTILAQASHPTTSHRLCRAPHLARDPHLEAHHLDRWEVQEVHHQDMEVPQYMEVHLKDHLLLM